MEEDVLEFLVTSIRLIKPFELCMFPFKLLEEDLNIFQLLRVQLCRKRLHTSIQQDVWFSMFLVVTVSIQKLIFGPRSKALTGFLVRDRCSHTMPQDADQEVGMTRHLHMTIYDGL